jgi:hypothetical protein
MCRRVSIPTCALPSSPPQRNHSHDWPSDFPRSPAGKPPDPTLRHLPLTASSPALRDQSFEGDYDTRIRTDAQAAYMYRRLVPESSQLPAIVRRPASDNEVAGLATQRSGWSGYSTKWLVWLLNAVAGLATQRSGWSGYSTKWLVWLLNEVAGLGTRFPWLRTRAPRRENACAGTLSDGRRLVRPSTMDIVASVGVVTRPISTRSLLSVPTWPLRCRWRGAARPHAR